MWSINVYLYMSELSRDTVLYESFIDALPKDLTLSEEQIKKVFDLFVKIAYIYFIELE